MRHFSNPYITGHFIMISVEETAVKVTPLSFFFTENRWSSFSKERLHYLLFYFIRS